MKDNLLDNDARKNIYTNEKDQKWAKSIHIHSNTEMFYKHRINL